MPTDASAGSGMSGALRSFLAHLSEALVLRGELASLEFKHEQKRFAALLLLFLVLAFGLFMAVLFFSAFVIILFWEARVLTTGIVVAVYLLLALLAGWKLHRILHHSPPAFAETLGVLRKDYQCLFGEQTNSNPPAPKS